MQISFFVCNEAAAEEFIYLDVLFEKRELTPQETKEEKTEGFYITAELFSLKEDIRISFQVRGKDIFFPKSNFCLYQLWQNGEEVKSECYGKRAQTVFRIVTIHREKLWMCLCLGGNMQAVLYQTGGTAISLGRGSDNTVCCAETDMLSKRHICIRTSGQETELLMEGRNGGYLNRNYLSRYERVILQYGDVIQLFGWTMIWLEELLAVYSLSGEQAVINLERYKHESDVLEKRGGYGHVFSPAPRNYSLPDKEEVELEFPPEKQEIEKRSLFLTIGPAFTMIIPMLLGFGAVIWNKNGENGQFLHTGLITAASSAVLGSFWAYMNIRQHKKGLRESERRRRMAYQNYATNCEQKIKEKYRHHQNVLRGMYLPIADCMREAGGLPCLWNRTERDKDFLACRVGIGNLPFDVPIVIPKERFSIAEDSLKEIPARLKKRYKELKEVPVCVDLREAHLCGVVAGRTEDLAGLLWLLALQISAACSEKQMRLVCLFARSKVPTSGLMWLRWLPHLWADEIRLLAFDSVHAKRIVYQAEQLLKEPGEQEKYWVVFTDDYGLLGKNMVEDERICVLLFANNYRELPVECRYILLKSAGFSGQIVLKAESAFRRELCFDSVCREEAETYARRMCGLASGFEQGKAQMPKKVTIFELFGNQKTNRDAICRRWCEGGAKDSLCIEIGVAEGSRSCFLDAHERGHGPHGLIAGMTGSGKSEMLQTIILSLAMRFSPLEVGFFLIDYKGGGMANLFAQLPHLLGSISNLSGGMIYRAMVSIRSENERRQRLFLTAAVNQIYDYQKLYGEGLVTIPLPHIFIIIDEFAELKREEPDFMRELVSVAQVGRSLGMHLILATQKPSGTVDDNIWSNARFRICLRVQDKQDSNEMLHRPDAAFLTNPGRAILQVGNDELYEMFQGAYTMEPYLEKEQEKESVHLLDEYGEKSSVYAPLKPYGASIEAVQPQIKKLLEEIAGAAAIMNVPKQDSLWLPVLPETLYLEEFCAAEQEQQETYQISVGRYDDPRHQKQGTYSISLPKGGHHVICGIAACGKSTFLQTILYALIKQETPETLQIYIIDYSSSLLAGFAQSSLVGGVITEEEQGQLPKLFFMLRELLLERKRLFQGGSFSQYCFANANAPPAILFVIDDYGGFREKTDGKHDDDMQELAKYGENYGIYLILTTSGIGTKELPARLFENCKTGICLLMSDKYRYCEVLRTMQIPLRPPENSRGRGIAWIEGELLEFQCAICMKSQNDFDRMERLRIRIQQQNEAFPNRRARRIPQIPEHPVLSEFFKLLDETGWQSSEGLPVGYEEQSGKIYGIPFWGIRHVLITGKKNTGKSNCLTIMKRVATRFGIFCKEIWSIGELAESIRENEEKVQSGKVSQELLKCGFLYLLPEYGRLCDAFYTKQYQKETETYLNGILGENGLHKVIAIVRKEDMGMLAGRPLFEVLIQEAYGIHMGGALESQSLFDFSEISFSRKSIVKKAGCGTVPRYRQLTFSGDVILPLCEEE